MVCLLWRYLRDVMILTVQAAEITPCAGDGQTGGTRMEMIERFLLHWIDGQGTGLAIDLAHKHATMIPPTATDTRLTFSDMTVMRTKRTLHSPILQFPIIPTFFHLQISINDNKKFGDDFYLTYNCHLIVHIMLRAAINGKFVIARLCRLLP